MPFEAANHLRADLLIGAHHVAQLFGVELLRQCGLAHQITEHDGQLPAFGFRRRRTGFSGRRTLCRPGSGRALALTAPRCGWFPCCLQGSAAVPAELGVGRIITLATGTAIRKGAPTLMTKLHPLRILKPTACTAHAASLLLRARQGKENVVLGPFGNCTPRAR